MTDCGLGRRRWWGGKFFPTRFRLLINGKTRGMCVCAKAGARGEGERRMETLRYARDPKRKHPIYLIVEDLGRESRVGYDDDWRSDVRGGW